jgi:hypothetical protein
MLYITDFGPVSLSLQTEYYLSQVCPNLIFTDGPAKIYARAKKYKQQKAAWLEFERMIVALAKYHHVTNTPFDEF